MKFVRVVHNLVASLKSPITVLNVSAHPVPIDSFKVSIILENVRTLVAASSIVLSFANLFIASKNMSVVSHPDLRVSLNAPSSAII